MGEFRIGRAFARHSYPDNRAAMTVPFARNSAVGPTADTLNPGTLQIPWSSIESGAPAGVNVPITPKSTGRIFVSGEITVFGPGEGAIDVQVQITLDGVVDPAPLAEKMTVGAGAFSVIPISAMLSTTLVPGVTRNIGILVTGLDTTVIIESSAIEVQEVVAATG